MSARLLFHGGMPGLRVGAVIVPDMQKCRLVDGCPTCAAQAANVDAGDPSTPSGWVYACADKPYARYYASRAVGGTLYRVRLDGDVEVADEDPPQFHAFRARRAVVVAVVENRIILTMPERLKLWKRWGGSETEFDQMVASVFAGRSS